MIIVKSEREIELMRRAGKITAAARALAGEMVKPGVTTREIDKAVFHFIRSQGAEPSFLNYNGYPASVCVSVNDEIIHGIPGPRVLKEGDIVSVDVGAYIGGFHGDCAATYPCGKISEEAQRLIDVTRQSFFEGFAQAREGNRISDISHAVQACVEANGFSVVREYVGHGVGRNMHEAPEIPNYGAPGHGPKLLRGMTIAVEPMVNAGTAAIRQMSDGWTVKTRDGKYAAHYENTILITAGEPEILTAPWTLRILFRQLPAENRANTSSCWKQTGSTCCWPTARAAGSKRRSGKSKSMFASSQRARRLSPRRSEARKKSQTVSFVKPSPHTAARKIRTRRDNTWQNPT